MRLTLNNFTKGLWLLNGKETTMEGFIRRAKGMHELRTPTLRTRAGCVSLSSNVVHTVASIAQLSGETYYTDWDGATVKFYKISSAGSLKTLTQYPNAILRLPPTGGQSDQLFVVDGTGSFKISSSGTITNWGIDAPPFGLVNLADGGAGAMAAGTYSYQVTFLNTNTGARSNPNLPATLILGANRRINITAIPTSADSQVNAREIWRTTASGGRLFKLTQINDNVTTTYVDNAADTALQALELPFDNAAPYTSAFSILTAWATVDRRVWWLSAVGPQAGNIYYSPPGRPESVRGFIFAGGTDEGLVQGLSWNTANWVFSLQRLFRIVGDDEPFQAVPIDGVPGLMSQTGLAITPVGIAYCSYNGVYLFDGSRAVLLGFDELAPYFRDETAEGLLPYIPSASTYLTYWREQLYLSQPTNNNQTLVYSFRTQSWRNLGIGLSGNYTFRNHLYAGVNGRIQDVENNNAINSLTDNGTAIDIEWEIGGALTDIAHYGTIQRLYLDLDTQNETITVELIIDGSTTSIGTASCVGRTLVELPVSSNWQARVFSVRLTGSVSNRVEVFAISVDVKLEGSNKDVGVG